MAIKLSLSEAQKNELIEFYRSEIKKLDQKKKEYVDLISQINGDQSRSIKAQSDSSELPSNYEPGSSLAAKARFVLATHGSPLTVREILNKIIIYEPSIKNEERKYFQYLSSTISTKCAQKQVFGRHQSPKAKGFLIGLIEWYDKNGTIKPEYQEGNPLFSSLDNDINKFLGLLK